MRSSSFTSTAVSTSSRRFGVNREPERVVGVGETFFEETGALHSAFGSADQTRARVLVFMVVPKGTNGEA